MAIKEVPTKINDYYKTMKEEYTNKYNELKVEYNKLENNIKEQYDIINKDLEKYKEVFRIDLTGYKEFADNRYTTGEFYNLSKNLFLNRNNNYTLNESLFALYKLAKLQYEKYLLSLKLSKYEKCSKMSLSDYREYLKIFYTEVERQLILYGNGYQFEGRLGYLAINRFKVNNTRKHLDFAATRRRAAEIRAKGLRYYNKEEEAWCKANGIEYTYVDKRVFLNREYAYEIPLMNCTLPNSTYLYFTGADNRGRSIRDKTNIELVKLCKGDKNKVFDYPVGINTKLNLCLEVDKLLYSKFIRNEDQKSIKNWAFDRKNRQRLQPE